MPKAPLHASALAHWDAGRLDRALADAWAWYDQAPKDGEVKPLLADLLQAGPTYAAADRTADIARLLRDPDVNPFAVARAGWHVAGLHPDSLDPAALAARIEADPLILALLEEAAVPVFTAEQALTALRRWLLLNDRAGDFPRTVRALTAQAVHNGGAWLFDAEERARLAEHPSIAPCYDPAHGASSSPAPDGGTVTAAVAGQYEAWPYPQWTRVTRRTPKPLAERVRGLDPDGPDTIPQAPEILVAGCGTGREVALLTLRYANARITAIDISARSLRYAADRLADCGLTGPHLQQLDLHDVAALGRRFDMIATSGVLHHLPDPEAGWAALANVLKPGGVMEVMLYSRIARLRVQALRAQFADLLSGPLDADRLREARRRVIARNAKGFMGSPDFFTLAGVHDLLLHRHEDPFDVPRIGRALDALGLELLAFTFPNRTRRARYRAEHPGDPLFRDRAAWAALERAEPTLFSGMYGLWCRKPLIR